MRDRTDCCARCAEPFDAVEYGAERSPYDPDLCFFCGDLRLTEMQVCEMAAYYQTHQTLQESSQWLTK